MRELIDYTKKLLTVYGPPVLVLALADVVQFNENVIAIFLFGGVGWVVWISLVNRNWDDWGRD